MKKREDFKKRSAKGSESESVIHKFQSGQKRAAKKERTMDEDVAIDFQGHENDSGGPRQSQALTPHEKVSHCFRDFHLL